MVSGAVSTIDGAVAFSIPAAFTRVTGTADSLLVDPWGKLLAEQASGEAVVVAALGMALPSRLRQEFPTLQHSRLK